MKNNILMLFALFWSSECSWGSCFVTYYNAHFKLKSFENETKTENILRGVIL